MKRTIRKKLLFLALICFAGAFIAACSNPALGDADSADPRARALNLPNSSWSDSLRPVTALDFSANRVTLSGMSTPGSSQNWYWGAMTGQTYTFEMVDDPDQIADIVDAVEDNWGTNTTSPDAVILVWTDPVKRIAFQFHYYAAATAPLKTYERLICWGVGNPHEFKRQ